MKSTEEYLYEFCNEMGRLPTNISDYQQSKNVIDLIAKYATLIDAVKIIKK